VAGGIENGGNLSIRDRPVRREKSKKTKDKFQKNPKLQPPTRHGSLLVEY
jgi:hypothetical protein